MDQAGGAVAGIAILIFLVILIIKLALTILVFALGVVIMALIPCAVGWFAYKTYLALFSFTLINSFALQTIKSIKGFILSTTVFI